VFSLIKSFLDGVFRLQAMFRGCSLKLNLISNDENFFSSLVYSQHMLTHVKFASGKLGRKIENANTTAGGKIRQLIRDFF
jgi:hypothetical protein